MVQYRFRKTDIPFSSIDGLDVNQFKNVIDLFYNHAQERTIRDRQDPDVWESTRVKADLDYLVQQMNPVVIGIMPNAFHYINEKIFPALITDDTRFCSTQIVYDNVMPTRNPERGTNRTFAHKTVTQESTLKRYGLHFLMADDLEARPEGKMDIMLNYAYIVGKFCENLAFLGMIALFSRDQRAKMELAQQFNADPLLNQRAYKETMLNIRDNFALVTKNKRGLSLLLEKAKTAIRNRCEKTEATCAVFPPDKHILIMSNSQFTDADKAGAEGPKRLWESNVITRMAGLDLVSAPPLPDNQENYTTLTQIARIGSYHQFHIFPDQGLDEGFGWYIYDSYSDSNQFFTAANLIDNCFVFAPVLDRVDGRHTGRWTVDYDTIDRVGRLMDPADRFGYNENVKEFEGMPMDAREIMERFDILGICPLETLNMQAFVVCIGGKETGHTLVTKPNARVGGDAANQTRLHNMTMWGGIHVNDYRRIEVVDNAFYAGIMYGHNSRIIDLNMSRQIFNQRFTLDSDESPSMYLVATKRDTVETGDFIHILGYTEANPRRAGNSHYDKASFWSTVYHWNSNMNMSSVPNMARTNVPAYVCFRRAIRYFTKSGVEREITGKTHHGPFEDAGNQHARRTGESYNIRTVDAPAL